MFDNEKKPPHFPIAALRGIKDTRRMWGESDPRDFAGGLVYDLDAETLCIVSVCCQSQGRCGYPRVPWRELYLYGVQVEPKTSYTMQWGNFAHRCVPLLRPHRIADLLTAWIRETPDLQRHAGWYLHKPDWFTNPDRFKDDNDNPEPETGNPNPEGGTENDT